MTNQVETKFKWEDFEVAEEQAKLVIGVDWASELIEEVIVDWHRPRVERWYIMPGLGPLAEQMHQYNQQEAILRNLTARAYGLTPAELGAAVTEGYISGFEFEVADFARLLEIARDTETINSAMGNTRTAIQALIDSVMASFDTFFKACFALFETQALCRWDEFVWKRQRRKRMRSPLVIDWWSTNMTPLEYRRMTEVAFNDLRTRGQREILDRPPSGVLDLGTLTKEEIESFSRIQQNRMRGSLGLFALCTPSRFRLTGNNDI